MNPYKILKVSKTASKEEIKRAYRKLVFGIHPDTNPDGKDSEKFQALHAAYRLLIDDARRAHYDATGDIGNAKPDNSEAILVGVLANCFAAVAQALLKGNKVLKNENIVLHMTNHFQNRNKELTQEIFGLETIKATLTDTRHRFSVDGEGENFFEAIVNSQILGITKNAKAMTDEIAINLKAMEALKRHKFNFEKKPTAHRYATTATTFMMFE